MQDKKHLVVMDTKNNRFEIDGLLLKSLEKAEVRITPEATEVTLTIDNCDVILQSEISIDKSMAKSIPIELFADEATISSTVQQATDDKASASQ